MRYRWFLACLSAMPPLLAAPTSTVFQSGPETRAAALDGPVVHFAAFRDGQLTDLPDLSSPGLTTLAAGPRGTGLYAGRGDRVLRLDGVRWVALAAVGGPVQQLLAAPDDSAALVVLTGRPAQPVLADGKVWRLPLANGAQAMRVAVVHDGYRPWALHRAAVGDEPRLAVNTYRATRFAPFEHKCFFLYRWQGETCESVWLGSRLSRPYVDAALADLRGDGRWRIVAVEVGEDGQPSVGVYASIGFGYEGEWRSGVLDGLTRVVADGSVAMLWGQVGGRPWLRQVVPDGEGYRLVELPAAPPDAERLALAGGVAVWYDRGWVSEPTGPTSPPTVTLAAVGDVLLARAVPQRIAAHGPAWLWAKLPPEWAAADLRFCNLECPVTTAGVPVPKRFCFKADPATAEKVLRAGRVDVVSVANNHTYDYQSEGLRQTRDWLTQWGVLPLGIGAGRAGAVKPVVLERNGLRIAWLAYTDWTPESYVPVNDGPALATVDDATLADEVRAGKAAGDVLVVSVHWGLEYSPDTTDRQRALAHAMIDAGADLVLGHHPHVAEPVEVYRERPICYSLGNCIFDRSGERVSNGLMVVARLAPSGATVASQARMVIDDARPVEKQP